MWLFTESHNCKVFTAYWWVDIGKRVKLSKYTSLIISTVSGIYQSLYRQNSLSSSLGHCLVELFSSDIFKIWNVGGLLALVIIVTATGG